MLKKALWALGLLLALGSASLLAAPRLVKWYVEKHYAGVQVARVSVHWAESKIVLFDVVVTRPGIEAHIEEAQVQDFASAANRVVTIHGGTLDVDLDKLPKSGTAEPKSGTPIVAYQLAATIKKGELQAVLKGTNIDLSEVCFESGTVTHPKATLEVQGGCVRRDKSQARAASVTVPLKLPFKIPRVNSSQTLTLKKVEATRANQLVKFEAAALGPFEAHNGELKLEEDGEVFLDIDNVTVNHPWVAPHPVTVAKVSVTAPGSIKNGEGILRIHLGSATIRIHPKEQWVEGEEACSAWFDALPRPLSEAMSGMAQHFSGQLSFEVKTKPTPYLNIKQSCKYVCSESPVKELHGPFTYQVYNSKGKLVDRKAGPGTLDWVPFGNLPPHVPEAFRLMEDPGFLSHHGIHVMALQNSLKANLEKGQFVKGGSTITMQLAKNLWLRRYKTIGRKAEEALMTLALESCFSKIQIIELYLNVVEFGPNLYGIGPAARHYFHKDPGSLTADEAFYLASVLPNPKKALPPEAGGLARARRIMKALANSGFITDALIPEDDGKPIDAAGWDTY